MVVLLAACAGPADNSPQGVCARKAEDDPQVKQLIMLSGTNATLQRDLRQDMQDARKQATRRCLETMGIETRGGVQSQPPALPR